MAFKKKQKQTTVARTPDQLFRDLPRRRHPSLYDHQGQVLRNYFEDALDKPDVALQLPTGSGKTLVGLLLAEWRRRKFKEHVIYLCPTRQLVKQVAEEASQKYGLDVETFIGPRADYSPGARASYDDSEKVAVTTYSSLFNTNPFFQHPEIIILDDVHTSENYIASLWTLQIERFNDDTTSLFRAVAGVLKSHLDVNSFERMTGNVKTLGDPSWVDKIPSPSLVEVADELRSTIDNNVQRGPYLYRWRAIRDHLKSCQIYISPFEILIRPLIPPTWDHPPFEGALQRIYMSATLGAGGDLERLTGRSDICRVRIPRGWNRQGIGRRLFLFPEKSLGEDEVKRLRIALMKEAGRSIVLTPSELTSSELRTEIKEKLGYPVYTGGDLEQRKAEFVRRSPAVAIVANRYDGIDLPDDECRVLFVEGLPQTVDLQEQFIMRRMGALMLFNERVQTRVLQAIGRCTRGLNDFSAVIVTNDELSSYLTDRKRRRFFHPELQAELEFGIEESREIDLDEFLDNFRIFIEHGKEWEEANEQIIQYRENSTQDLFPAMDDLSRSVSDEIAWQKALWKFDYASAFEAGRDVLSSLVHEELRGYRTLWHYLTGSAAHLAVADGDRSLVNHAREQFDSARRASTNIGWLVRLARTKTVSLGGSHDDHSDVMLQIERLERYLARLKTLHNRDFAAREAEIRNGLRIQEQFERAHVMLGSHLGFEAGKVEDDASPDPWWHSGSVTIVFEDHANAEPHVVVSANKARQARSHPDWIHDYLPHIAEGTVLPVLITPATKAKKGAMPNLHNVSLWNLKEFLEWSDIALDTVREIRRSFSEPGDLVWKADAALRLQEIHADASGLCVWLSDRRASQLLETEK